MHLMLFCGARQKVKYFLPLVNAPRRLGSSPSLMGLKITMHASGQKRRENMREK